MSGMYVWYEVENDDDYEMGFGFVSAQCTSYPVCSIFYDVKQQFSVINVDFCGDLEN